MTKRVLSWGTFMCDIIATGLDKVAEPGVIEYLREPIHMRLGGHPVDLIIDLAKIGVDPAWLGVVSTIGADSFGDFLLGEIAPYGFEAFVRRVEGGTGKTLILAVKGQDRLCHLDPAACMAMSLDHLRDVLCRTTPEFLSIRPGYTNLDTQMASLLADLRRGPLADTWLLLDLCAPYRKEWSYYLELLPHVDAVHGNSKEIIRASGETTFATAAQKILSLGPGTVLVTKEAQGAELITRQGSVVQPSFDIRFVEPSGCGDAFCAGVIHQLMQIGKSIDTMSPAELSQTLLWGQALGAAAATEVGCVAGVTASRVHELIETQQARILQETVWSPS